MRKDFWCSTGLLSGTRGASILEFAIVAPIVFLFLFGFIDVARYWQLKSSAAAVAQFGVGLAVIQPGLDVDLNTTDPILLAERDAAMQSLASAVKSKSKEMILAPVNELTGSTFSTEPVIFIPTPDRMRDDPVTVTLTVPYTPLFGSLVGFPGVDVQVVAAGFREPKRIAAQPVPTDCWGTPYDLTSPPGGGLFRQGCPCENGNLSFVWGGNCVCSETLFQNGTTLQADNTCGCGDGMEPLLQYSGTDDQSAQVAAMMNAMSAVCCPTGTPKTCPAGQTRDFRAGECECHCLEGADIGANDECFCSDPNKKYTSEGCVCKTPEESNGELEECTNGASRDPETCECSCQGGSYKTTKTSWCEDVTECKCPGKANLQDGVCVCALTCAPPRVLDTAACACSCPPGQIKQADGSCGCPANKIPSGNSCVCDPALLSNCGPEEVLNPSNCQCQCPNGGTASNGHCCPQGAAYDNNSGQCSCGNPNKSVVGNKCACTNTTAPPGTPFGAYQESGGCNWICPSWTTNYGYVCCPGDSTPVAGGPLTAPSCSCSNANKQWNVFKGKCECKTSLAACPAGQIRDPNTCQCGCPADSDPAGDGQSCVCKDPNKGWTSSGCQCNPCPPGFSRKAGSCECECNGAGLKIVNGFCAGLWCGDDCTFTVAPSGEVSCDCHHG